MFHKVLRLAFERGFLMTIIRLIDKLIRYLILLLLRVFCRVDEKKILFLNFTGNYDCNPKAICQELVDRDLDLQLVWGINKATRIGPLFFPEKVRTVVRGTYDFYREIASARIIVDNGISTAWLKYRKKKNQILIETWHGSLGIKKFGPDANNDKHWLKLAAREGRMTDYIISNSTFENEIYREDFWKETPIWLFGHPRNDILFCRDEERIAALNRKIRSTYQIPEDVKLCLYAPTFREGGDLSPYILDYDRLTAALSERFGGSWMILTRFHARTKKYLKGYTLPETVKNLSGYPDIQELMLIIDAGITDYSSWICEYMLRRKPGFTFATDAENYVLHQRTLFFPLSALPFPTSSNEEELIESILSFDEKKFAEDCDAFLREKGSVDDGHASERTADEIEKLLNLRK